MIPESICLRFTVALPEEQKECKKNMHQTGKRQIECKKLQSIDQHRPCWIYEASRYLQIVTQCNDNFVCQWCEKRTCSYTLNPTPSVVLTLPFLWRSFLLPGCILAWGRRSAARWLRLFASPQYYRVSNICHLRHLWRTKPHKTGFIGWARHCCCASLRTCSHLSSIFDSPIFLMVIDTPYNHSFDDLSMSTTRSWMFANHIYLRAGKPISPFANSSSFVAKRGPGAWFCNWARLVVHNCTRGR